MLEYIVRYDGRQVNRGGAWSLYDDLLEQEAGTFGSYSFTLAPTHPMADPATFVTEDASHEVTFSERYANGEEAELFRGWVKKTSMDTDLMLTVECEGMLAYLKSTVVRPYACKPMADLPDGTELIAGDPFEWLILQHNEHCPGDMAFYIGFNPHVGEVSAGTSFNSTWDELNDKFCSGLDRYLNARTDGFGRRLIDLLDGGVGEGTQVIVLGENVVSMDISGESSEIVTAIVPRATLDDTYNEIRRERTDRPEIGISEADIGDVVGNCSTISHEGDRVVNWDMVRAYGFREEKRDYEAEGPEDLARKAMEDLNPQSIGERTANAIEVRAIDLHTANPGIQPIRLLEWDRVFVRAYGLEDEGAEYGVNSGGRLILDQWLPCSKLHISSVHPEDSWYRFGDLPQTLTRMSALRMGVLRRGDGTLVRRTDGTPWNNDRIWNRAQELEEESKEGDDELWKGLDDATTEWGNHLEQQFDEATKRWYEHLDEAIDGVSKEDAQGREELLKHMEEIEGTWSDELGHIDQELEDLSGTVDSNHRTLLDGLKDVALSSQRTCFGICSTPSGSAYKTVSSSMLTRPGGEAFQLAKGAVVDIQFTYENEGTAYLNVADSGDHRIRTNGLDFATWHAGEVVQFVYDGTYWQSCSTDIFANSVTVGHPQHANFYTDGNEASLRIGSTPYWKASMTGQTIGLESGRHVDIGSDYIDLVYNSRVGVHVGYDSDSGGSRISSTTTMKLQSATGSASVLLGNQDTYITGHSLHISANEFYLLDGLHPVVSWSLVVNVPAGQDYVDIPAGSLALGGSGASGYAWIVSNGDLGAQNVAATGASYNPSTRGIRVHLSATTSGSMRLNLWGFYCAMQYSDEGGEPPEIIGDEGADSPSIESTHDVETSDLEEVA